MRDRVRRCRAGLAPAQPRHPSDPRADHVLTYVPGMTADLASHGGELTLDADRADGTVFRFTLPRAAAD